MMETTTVFLAEDHTILREGLRMILSSRPGLEVVGEAEDGQDAIQQIRKIKPHVVLMDLSMPHLNGTEAIGIVKRRNPEIKVIALTVHKSVEYVRATLNANADGYVLKDDTHDELLNAISSVLKGNIYLSPGICDKVINGFLDHTPSSTSLHSWDSLTERERQVIKLIAEGSKNREIADFLSLSVKTVEKHRSNLMKKLGLHSASALTTYAIKNGMMT
jgi:two-component system response regulator NreC